MKLANLLSRIILTILGYEDIYLERNDQEEIKGETLAKKKKEEKYINFAEVTLLPAKSPV